ncbi:hypothetical protein [Desulfospira joergensenii]|uniref:hypothetical protein n=1 Tax=Desulfospira joergensenii TaxID=53329 RepID=UPI0003B789B4|nr:hypothetical protein [Desulfospira joergensenii]
MVDVFEKNAATSAEDAEKLVPRAEFRVFGQNILDIVTQSMWKAQAKLFKIRTSSEIYIVSRLTNEANVKIRDGLLDIKIKVSETADGYEVFQPRGKFQFPVNKEELGKIFENLQADVVLDKDTYTLDEFISMVDADADLSAVDVQKERYGFSVDGMICEYGKVLFNGALIETACVESEDYEGMKKAIKALEIDGLENVNYLKAAKSVLKM